MHRKRPFLDTSRINEEDCMAGPAQYFVSLGVLPACRNPPALVKTAPRTPCRCQACYRRTTWTRVQFEQGGPETNPAEPSFATNSKVNQRSFKKGDWCMYNNPQNGEMKVEILNVKEFMDESGNEDFTYTIYVDGREKDTYADKLTPIDTEDCEPSAPPLTSRESSSQSLYPTPQSQLGVVYCL